MAIEINGIPVPEGTDTISAEALQAMVTALTGQLNTHLADYAELLAGGTPYTLTLINGWTGTLKVKKNKLNQLHIWGVISPGITDVGTTIAEIIPPAYRVTVDGVFTITIPAHTVNGGILGLAYVSGNLRIYRPAAVELGTDDLRINYIIQSA